ncbi:putative nuclease HARBI1 [Diachasma alloeum]|uniref:putative nuclease HARBI1 n=1 Tax=Diachasma alloeum TaxID=454923 RepID=UPI0010FB6F89|nr:putative nuclease HARBI1 [Diachasma alloeum]
MRMTVQTFDYVLSNIGPSLVKNWCNLHSQPIMPEERLVLTIRFLATGSTYSTLAFSFKMGIKTVSVIIAETMNTFWLTLTSRHMPVPSVSDFLKISQDFQKKWKFPHCLGAIDGRHVAVKKPPNSGKLYYNFKGYHSIVLQAVVDANYRYIFIDVGGFGCQHDSTTFKASQFYKALMTKKRWSVPSI